MPIAALATVNLILINCITPMLLAVYSNGMAGIILTQMAVYRFLIVCSLLAMAAPSSAQDKPYKFEITPFVGYRFGGHFEDRDSGAEFELGESDAWGVNFNILANPNGQWEVLYSHQGTDLSTQGLFTSDPFIDLDVEYLQFGGTYLFDGINTRPFIALTLGVTQFDPQPAEFNSETFFSASFAGGLQLNANKRFGIRLEGRVFATFVDSSSSIFCSSVGGAGACLIQIDGTIVTQWEGRVGLVFRF